MADKTKPLTNFDNQNIPHGYVLIDGKIVMDELNKSIERDLKRKTKKGPQPS